MVDAEADLGFGHLWIRIVTKLVCQIGEDFPCSFSTEISEMVQNLNCTRAKSSQSACLWP